MIDANAREGVGPGAEVSNTGDPLAGDPRLAEYFGERLGAVSAFRDALVAEGETRGLIGPREAARLWERHLLNSAAVVPFLRSGAVIDVGSGAGLPGLVIAAMEPRREVVLIEPMERRATWLEEIALRLGLANVRVIRARAESAAGLVRAPAVTARAVAPLAKLARWCLPLAADGGQLLFLKGRGAADEVASAAGALRSLRLEAEVLEAVSLPGLEATRVIRLVRAPLGKTPID
ncbi:MAG TPA: 16S rRNA (guanine(527)-N(7))-methyltransferase RsmG [Demequinaceae bacterium]